MPYISNRVLVISYIILLVYIFEAEQIGEEMSKELLIRIRKIIIASMLSLDM